MSEIKDLNWMDIGQRLRKLLGESGISQNRLASYLGYSETMISRILKGERGFGPLTLNRLVRLFERSMQEILEGPLVEDQSAVFFMNEDRTILPSALAPRIRGYAMRYADAFDLFRPDGRIDPTQLRVKSETQWMRGGLTANNLRHKIGRETGPLIDLVGFVEDLGIAVAIVDSDSVRGVSFHWPEGERAIVVGSGLHPDVLRFTIAHELGHIFLEDERKLWDPHFKETQQKNRDRLFLTPDPGEQAANAFAAHLLLPDTDVDNIIPAPVSEMKSGNPLDQWSEAILYLRQEYGVGADIAWWRIRHLGYMNQELAEKYWAHARLLCNDARLAEPYSLPPDITRLGFDGFNPSRRYQRLVNLLRQQEKLTAEEAVHLLGGKRQGLAA
ncbi:MAG TPA: ImmA/IrrE family metallo-endopeptidase [Bacteroidetes bacterium]|nr:helix-turn-helix protein [bacterium BMS3Bbin04]HDO64990.1 ImmA/IrrE family metallo-endopeptidase [Bacteroidota bacterium]HEX04115.1 ImmA/IrrE family metallo-endopeptidase [Bacteroidota bacterium]